MLFATVSNCSSLKEVTVHWTNSAAIIDIRGGTMVFSDISSSDRLHIPAGMKSAYDAKGWLYYFAEVVDY